MEMIQELQINELEQYLNNNIDILEKTVNKYGILKSIKNEADDENLTSDFLFLCLTKGIRSLKAAHLLAEEGFFEDIFILLRSTYESYLHISFIKKNPKQIHKLTTIKMGIRTNQFKHPKNAKGQDIKQKIFHPLTGKEVKVEISIKKMSQNTLHKIDEKIHDGLYSYLSEFSHVNIIALGNYVSYKTKKFIIKSEYETKIFQSIILSLFVSWLLLDVLLSFDELIKEDYETIQKQVNESGMLIYNYIQILEIENEELVNLKNDLLERINNVLNLV